MKPLNCTILTLWCCLLVACGGGGGDGGASGAASAGSAGGRPLISGIDFREPASFINDPVYETALGLVSFRGGLSSVLAPQLDCSGGSASPAEAGIKIRWENVTSGERGETSAFAGCVDSGTIFGVGVRTFWAVDFVRLELGLNEFRFLSYVDGELRGEDVVHVRRTDGTVPEVSYRYPADDASGVPLNRAVVVGFNEPMLEGSLHTDRLELVEVGGGVIPGLHTYEPEHHVWTFTPATTLNPETRYEIRLSGAVKDQWSVPLGDPTVWAFQTGAERDDEPPVVVRRWPDADGCDCADPGTEIQIGFSEPMAADALAPGIVSLASPVEGPVAVHIDYRGDYLALRPEAPLAENVEYRVEVAAGLLDAAGNRSVEVATWSFRTGSGVAMGEWRQAAAPPFELSSAGGVWTGDSLFLWGEARSTVGDCAEAAFCEEEFLGRGLLYDPSADRWDTAAFEKAQYDFDRMQDVPRPFPVPRRSPSLLWTGAEVLLFGGWSDTGPVGKGGAYDPLSDSWREISGGWTDPTTRRVTGLRLADHVALWTGVEMIVWGGRFDSLHDDPVNRGWRYDPMRDEWLITGIGPDVDVEWHLLPDQDPLAPQARTDHTAVWTGSELIVWGGESALGEPLADGGRYDPASNSWGAMSDAGAPLSGAGTSSAAWIGDEMLVWNGGSEARSPGSMRTVELHRYDPGSDTWLRSAAGWEPAFDNDALEIIAAGDRLLAVGVTGSSTHPGIEGLVWTRVISAYEYDPQSDRWRHGGEIEVESLNSRPSSFDAVWADGVLLLVVDSELVIYTPSPDQAML